MLENRPGTAAFLGGIVGTVGTLAAALVAAWFGYLNKDRELDIEMVRVSLSILTGENKETSLPGRRFALKALDQYSGIRIPDQDEWARNGTVTPNVLFNWGDTGKTDGIL